MNSAHGSASGAGWYNSGTSATAGLSTATVSAGAGVRYVFTGWSSDAAGTSFSSSETIAINGPKTATANWKIQYYLDASSNFGTVSPGSDWYDEGSNVTISPTVSSVVSGERYVWNNWTGTGTNSYTGSNVQIVVTMLSPVNEAASWTHQYMLTVQSPYGSPTPTTEWLDAGTSVRAFVETPVADSAITQYACSGWKGTGSIPTSGTANMVEFTLTQPSRITWEWHIQYLVVPVALIIVAPLMVALIVVGLVLKRKRRRMLAGNVLQHSSTSDQSSLS